MHQFFSSGPDHCVPPVGRPEMGLDSTPQGGNQPTDQPTSQNLTKTMILKENKTQNSTENKTQTHQKQNLNPGRTKKPKLISSSPDPRGGGGGLFHSIHIYIRSEAGGPSHSHRIAINPLHCHQSIALPSIHSIAINPVHCCQSIALPHVYEHIYMYTYIYVYVCMYSCEWDGQPHLY